MTEDWLHPSLGQSHTSYVHYCDNWSDQWLI